ncbi:Elongation factor 1-delta, partial [Galemys pyrenaicus]
ALASGRGHTGPTACGEAALAPRSALRLRLLPARASWRPGGVSLPACWWGLGLAPACPRVATAFLCLLPNAVRKMRSGKAACALETVWEDKQKCGDAERRFYEHQAARAAAQQPPAEAPANGPRWAGAEVAEAQGGSGSEPGKGRAGRRPLQKKRKRSPRSGPGRADLALVGLSADHIWLDKPLFDRAESSYRQKLADVAAQTAWPPTLAPRGPCAHGSQAACHHVAWGVWVNKSAFDQAERAFVEWSQALLLAAEGAGRQGLPSTSQQGPTAALACLPGPPPNGQPPLGSLQALVQGVWLEKPRYDAAERGFYEALFDGHPPGKIRLQERAGQAEGARRGRRDRRGRNMEGSKRAGPRRAEGEAAPAPLCWHLLRKDAEAPWLSKPAYDSAERRHHATEALRLAWRLEAASLAQRVGARPSPAGPSLRPNLVDRDSSSRGLSGAPNSWPPLESRWSRRPAWPKARGAGLHHRCARPGPLSPVPPSRKMATNFLLHEKIWFDKFKYDDAERRFYEQMNGPAGSSAHQENGASVILRDIARARENIQKSLAGLQAALSSPPEAPGRAAPGTSAGPGASSGPGGDHAELAVRVASLEAENQGLRGVVQDLQRAVAKLEARLSALERGAPAPRTAAPQTQHVSPMRQAEPPTRKAATATEDDEDDDIDLFGSDEEEDKEAARLREERLRQYAEKKAKKPALVAKSSILLDVKPWDDETDMGQLEACVRSVQLDGLTWGGSKLVPVGYGIRKLQIQCVVEDDKVGTDLLEEEITKFEEHVQSVDIAAFNKI